MKKLASFLLGAAGLLAAPGAFAADVTIPAAVPPPVVVAAPPAPAGFDWSRAYFGVSAGSWRESNFSDHDGFLSRLMAQAGVNFEVGGGRLVVGVEGQAGVNDFLNPGGNGPDFEYAVLGKAGVALGGRVLVYATGGIGNGPNYDLGTLLGGGLEIGIGSRIGVKAEGLLYRPFGFPGFVDHILVGGGINIYFGR